MTEVERKELVMWGWAYLKTGKLSEAYGQLEAAKDKTELAKFGNACLEKGELGWAFGHSRWQGCRHLRKSF